LLDSEHEFLRALNGGEEEIRHFRIEWFEHVVNLHCLVSFIGSEVRRAEEFMC